MTQASARLSLVTDEIMSLTSDLREATRQLPEDNPDDLLERVKLLKLKAERLIIVLDRQMEIERELRHAELMAQWNRNARMEKEYPTAGLPCSKANPRWSF